MNLSILHQKSYEEQRPNSPSRRETQKSKAKQRHTNEAIRFQEFTDTFLNEYTWLGNSSDKRYDFLFAGVPKLHMLWHLAYHTKYINPRRAANFVDEHFQKIIKILAEKCTAGTRLHNVLAKIADKYCWASYLEDYFE